MLGEQKKTNYQHSPRVFDANMKNTFCMIINSAYTFQVLFCVFLKPQKQLKPEAADFQWHLMVESLSSCDPSLFFGGFVGSMRKPRDF